MHKVVYSPYQLEMAVRKVGIRGSSSGSKGKYHCPFHADKTPSLFISYNKCGYNCFSCHSHGSIFQLIKEVSGKSIDQVLNSDSFDTLWNVREPVQGAMKPEVPVEIRGTAMPWKISQDAQAYTKKRGIPEQVCLDMEMSFIRQAYVNGREWYNRLLIPTYNDTGVMINVEGRDTTFQSKVKVLYPAGALKPLYEWYKLKTNETLFMIEGLIKLGVLRSDSFFANSSTSMGGYISPYQESFLKRFNDVCVVMDNDDAGENFYKRIKEIMLPLDKKVRYIRLNAPIKDVDQIPTKLNMTVKEFRESGKMEFEVVL